ncbi:hypothetical protein AC792_14525 [Arthrobacter sp. RIT-PI-e]|uniref:DUF2332 domain-containing protein n=1 Tax=Arthrobacter sp. RIT-PI-e TaxID=1681197 RepID=UPI000675CC50|nr:DUF2332 domain-containing protein [Arthrobacter sp. RIT-PI-e]KNC17293.1 hypothetical protein AC792_14525 [Arthrobacter sp. RIT-PI-e]
MTAGTSTTAARFRRFAEIEVRGVSPLYEQWCLGISTDPELLTLLDHLPSPRRQPNLLLGAARLAGVPLEDYRSFRRFVLQHWETIRRTLETRTTQTNEAGRCAVLLPLLTQIGAAEGRPLALIEVGASAGLCLYPDRYAYRYSPGPHLAPASGSPMPALDCRVSGPAPLPSALPEIVWRAGVDLSPLRADVPDDVRWLEALVWPGQEHRTERLRAALGVVRREPPLLVEGDLNEEIAPLVARAPQDAVVVVFHTAVLAYLDAAGRARFASTMTGLTGQRERPVHWISNEGAGTLTGVAGALGKSPGERDGSFVLRHDGRTVARTGPHGQYLDWLP